MTFCFRLFIKLHSKNFLFLLYFIFFVLHLLYYYISIYFTYPCNCRYIGTTFSMDINWKLFLYIFLAWLQNAIFIYTTTQHYNLTENEIKKNEMKKKTEKKHIWRRNFCGDFQQYCVNSAHLCACFYAQYKRWTALNVLMFTCLFICFSSVSTVLLVSIVTWY